MVLRHATIFFTYTTVNDGCFVTKKAVISIDLASMAGTLMYDPGVELPRNNKRLLEQMVASTFLEHLSQRDSSKVTDIQSNPTDPPDVMFTYNGELRGIELSEFLPDNRLQKDSILLRLRRAVISRLILGDNTRGFVVTIFLADGYASHIRPGRIDSALADALANFFDRGNPNGNIIEVPKQIQNIVTRISVFREDLTGDPRLQDNREPLVVFDAQDTLLVPEEDCPAMVKTRLVRKGLQDFAIPTWLLLWSNHHALSSLRDHMDNAVGSYLRSHPMNYERVFHLHLFPHGGATEFPQIIKTTGA